MTNLELLWYLVPLIIAFSVVVKMATAPIYSKEK